MAKCNACGKEMLDHVSCDYNFVTDGKEVRKRIKCGDPKDLHNIFPGETCHDCGAPYGGYHHINCDSETCPFCGGQLLSCDCEIYYSKIGNTSAKSILKPFVYEK